MTAVAQKIFKEALNLQPVERAELIDMLFHSFDSFENAEIETAWKNEVENRIEAMENGRMRMHTEDEAFARINKG